jgi:hypothetical protein
MRARPDGTADHEHRLSGEYWKADRDRACVVCGLAVADWPPVIPAHWHEGRGWLIYWGPAEQSWVEGDSRRKAQNAARTAILARLPNARIKWLAQ